MTPTLRARGSGRGRLTLAARAILVAASGATVCLLLLAAHIFVPAPELQLAALWLLGGSLLTTWFAILAWRMPVFENRVLAAIASAWCGGIALAVVLVRWSLVAARSAVWERSAQWLAVTLSFAAGALLLRALLRKRTTSVVARLLSLLSPLAIVVWIVVASLRA